MNFLNTLLSFFSIKDKRYAIFLLGLMLFTAFIELIGIGSLFPYIKILGNNEIIHSNSYLNGAYHFFHLKSDNQFLILLGVLIFCLILSKAMMSTLNNYFQAKMTFSINNRMSKYCLSSYLYVPYVRSLDKNSSILSKHLLVDVSSVSTMIQSFLTLLTDIIVAISLIALMIFIDPFLVFGVVFSLGAMFLLINRSLKKRINILAVNNEKGYRHAYKTATEALSGLKDVKIHQSEDYFIDRYLKWQRKISNQMVQFSVLSNLPANLLNVMGFGVLMIVLLYLVITHGNFLAILPTIGVIAVAVQRLLPSATRISTSIANIRRFKPVVFIVRETIDYFKNVNKAALSLATDPSLFLAGYVLRLDGLSYTYPASEQPALTNINYLIKKNSCFGIVGESGAGKSTLVDLMLGLLSPTSGHISCSTKNIGYIPQQVFLLDATIRENIAFGIPEEEINQAALEKAVSIAQLDGLIADLPDGLNTEIGEKGAKLSGGQRQRIGIARALYRDPEILIMDEATNALDAATENNFNQALKSLMGSKTLIIIAHRLSSVMMCDHIVQLERGRIVAEGSYVELYNNSESFRRIYNLAESPT